MSKYYIQINKDGRPLEGGVVSKRKPKYGLYQTIDSWCCNTFPAIFSNNGSPYIVEELINGDTIQIQIESSNGISSYSNFYTLGNVTWTLNDFIKILNDNFSIYGHWEKDPVKGIKLVESSFKNIVWLYVYTYFD